MPDDFDDLSELPESPQPPRGFRGLLLAAPATATAEQAKALGYLAWSEHDLAEFNRLGCTDPLRAVVLTAVAPALQLAFSRRLALGEDSEPLIADIEEGVESITGCWFNPGLTSFIGQHPGTWHLQACLGAWRSEIASIRIVTEASP